MDIKRDHKGRLVVNGVLVVKANKNRLNSMNNLVDNIDIQIVKKLREKTGVGYVDCKKALLVSGGDIDDAVDILYEAGYFGAYA